MSSLQSLHTDFLEDLEIGQGRSARTVATYDFYLQRFYEQQHLETVKDITLDTVRAFRRHLNEAAAGSGEGLALVTQNYHLIALRQFLKYLARRDVRALSPEKIGLAKTGERDIDVLYPEEVDSLLAAVAAAVTAAADASERLSAQRDAAILITLFATGLRISELTSLDRDDIRLKHAEIPVRGKGNKVRVVFLSPEAVAAIQAYLDERTDLDPALFIRHHPPPRTADDSARLTPRSIQRLIKKYAALAGLTKNITPHTLRHSFATDLLSNGADVRQVQQLLGHASITTTQIYTHLTDVHLREVHQRFHRKTKS